MPEEEKHRNALHYLTITVLQINRFVKKILMHLVLRFFLEYILYFKEKLIDRIQAIIRIRLFSVHEMIVEF